MQNPNSNVSLKRSRSQLSDEYGSFKILHIDDDNASNSSKRIISEYKITYNETRQTNRHKTPSGVWKYFALASKNTTAPPEEGNATKLDAEDRLLCMLCYAKGQVHIYKSKTSSSNLWKHLNRKHGIEIPTEKIFAVCTSSLDRFEYENDEGQNSNDYQTLTVLENESNDVLVKDEHIDGKEEYTEEEEEDHEEGGEDEMNVQYELLEGDDEQQNIQTILKYDDCSSTITMQKDIGLLIVEEVAKRPILYDVTESNKMSSIKATKEVLWAEIYETLGQIIPIERIQKIWKNIRDRYKRIRNMERDGQECSPKYKYYDHLGFLDEAEQLGNHLSGREFEESSSEKKARPEDFSFLIEQNDSSMLTSVDDFVQSDQNYTTGDVVSETSSNCIVSSSNPPIITATIYPMDNLSAPKKQTLAAAPSPSPTPTQQPQEVLIQPQRRPQTPPNDVPNRSTSSASASDDEFELFGKLIANKLRSAPRDRVNLIEVKIMQAILENT